MGFFLDFFHMIEQHLCSIFTLLFCILSTVGGTALMIRGARHENHAQRRLACLCALILVSLSDRLGASFYVFVVGAIESGATAALIGFLVVGMLCVIVLPIAKLWRYISA